jgi:hypothetical protein
MCGRLGTARDGTFTRPKSLRRNRKAGGALGHRLTGITRFLNEVAVAELRVVAVGVEQCASPVGLDEFGVGDGVGTPAVVGLASELEYPARHRDGDPVGGELSYERVEPFPGRLACDR